MLSRKYPHMFQPIRIGKLILKNRITNAPTYNFLASYDNHITREGIEFSKPVGRGGTATVTLLAGGRRVPAMTLKPADDGEALPASFLSHFLDRDWDNVEPTGYEPDQICHAIREGGVVGLGGATFPTHIKLKKNRDRPVDTVILNGCECEPYLTSDHRLMVEAPEPIVVGLQLAAHASGASRAIIAI